MNKRAKQYSAEEKAKIALLAIKGEMTIAQISSKYGVDRTQIANWKKQAFSNMVSGFLSNRPGQYKPAQEGLVKQLYEQIGQLSVERDWLKKIYNVWIWRLNVQ